MKSRNDTRRPEEIENEIEQTRTEMAQTLNAIQKKFSPGQLLDQTLGYFQSGSGEFGSNLGNTIKQNPVPVALVGIGLGWLMMSSSHTASRHSYSSQEGYATGADSYHSPSMGERLGEAQSRAGETTSSARHKVGETASNVSHKVGETASNVSHKVGETASSARHKVGETASKARYQTERLGDSVHYQTQRVRTGFRHILQEQPLVLGALGIAIGAALGAGLPSTRRENQWMGEKRDELLHRTKETGEEQLHKAQRVAEATQQAAKEEADRQGLTREAAEEQLRQTRSKAQSVAEAARDAAKDEAERQHLTREAAEEQLGQAQSKVQSVAEAARDAARKEADKQGLASRDQDNRQQL
jgi:ElaB/YqjD/DUF883 family membrane-anchored ribosome-binding protein